MPHPEPRTVEAPPDLVRALKAAGALAGWEALSFTHQREHVEAIEDAQRPQTRASRIENAVAMIAARLPVGAPTAAVSGRPTGSGATRRGARPRR